MAIMIGMCLQANQLSEPFSNLHARIEYCRAQPATRCRKSVGKLGPDTGGAKCAAHFARFIEPVPVEDENILHADNLPFHAGDF